MQNIWVKSAQAVSIFGFSVFCHFLALRVLIYFLYYHYFCGMYLRKKMFHLFRFVLFFSVSIAFTISISPDSVFLFHHLFTQSMDKLVKFLI